MVYEVPGISVVGSGYIVSSCLTYVSPKSDVGIWLRSLALDPLCVSIRAVTNVLNSAAFVPGMSLAHTSEDTTRTMEALGAGARLARGLA